MYLALALPLAKYAALQLMRPGQVNTRKRASKDQALSARLLRSDINARVAGNSVRSSPSVYSDLGDVEAVLEALQLGGVVQLPPALQMKFDRQVIGRGCSFCKRGGGPRTRTQP
jgi:hypothetical protein